MKKLIILVFSLISYWNYSQVAIGTTNPNSSSILELESTTKTFVPPRMSVTEMNAISNPLNGSIVYNTTEDAMYVKTSTGWKSMFFINNDVILLNKAFSAGNNALSTGNNTYYDLPIGSSDVIQNEASTYTVEGNGTIRILKSGVYSIIAGLSTSNLPAGDKKYIIGIYKNGTLYNYLARGIVNNPATDYFGFSGSSGITVNANDVIKVRYVLNNDNINLDANYINIGITRLK